MQLCFQPFVAGRYYNIGAGDGDNPITAAKLLALGAPFASVTSGYALWIEPPSDPPNARVISTFVNELGQSTAFNTEERITLPDSFTIPATASTGIGSSSRDFINAAMGFGLAIIATGPTRAQRSLGLLPIPLSDDDRRDAFARTGGSRVE